MSSGKTLLLTAGAVTAGTVAYAFIARSWLLRWGATDQEARQTLPGDELVPHPRYVSTRAITTHAPASQVWPWLVQMGQGRGGLYSYDWLENLIGCDIHSMHRIVPELQHLTPGDVIRLTPTERNNLFMRVAIVEPDRALVLVTPGSVEESFSSNYPYATWAFILHSLDEKTCRLIVRWRSDFKPSVFGLLANKYFLEPVHFIMERKMILGIKQRAEQTH
jgi:hypothetical protein